MKQTKSSPARYTTVVSGKDQETEVTDNPPALQGFKSKRSPQQQAISFEEPSFSSRPFSDDSGRVESSVSADIQKVAVSASPQQTKSGNLGFSMASISSKDDSVPRGDYFTRNKSQTWSSKSNPFLDSTDIPFQTVRN